MSMRAGRATRRPWSLIVDLMVERAPSNLCAYASSSIGGYYRHEQGADIGRGTEDLRRRRQQIASKKQVEQEPELVGRLSDMARHEIQLSLRARTEHSYFSTQTRLLSFFESELVVIHTRPEPYSLRDQTRP